MIRIALVEDHSKTRELFLKLLRGQEDIVCVGAYANADQAEQEIPQNLPEVVLMDINLPRRNGIECVRKLKIAHPQIEFVMLTTYDDPDLIFGALRAGASGYLLKRSSPEQIVAAIKEVHRGGAPMSMEIARLVVTQFIQSEKIASQLDQLTKREHEILALLAKGLTYKEIASHLGISVGTVEVHQHKIYGKLHVQSRTEAVLKYLGK